jgi:hypothetical protein
MSPIKNLGNKLTPTLFSKWDTIKIH